MSTVTERAQRIGELIADADPDHADAVSYDVRNVYVPGWLVVPLPDFEFDMLGDAGETTLTWTVYALHTGPGDLEAADTLGSMVAAVNGLGELSFERAEPARYAVPGASDALPAYKLTMTETVEVSP